MKPALSLKLHGLKTLHRLSFFVLLFIFLFFGKSIDEHCVLLFIIVCNLLREVNRKTTGWSFVGVSPLPGMVSVAVSGRLLRPLRLQGEGEV